MVSPPKDRRERIQQVWRKVWLPLRKDYYRGELSEPEFKHKEFNVLRALADLCGPEIVETFEKKGSSPPPGVKVRIVLEGVRDAVASVTESKKALHEHIKRCVADRLDQHIRSLDEWFYQAKPEELLVLLLRASWQRAEILISYTTLKQAQQLLSLLVAIGTGGRAVFYRIPAEQEPKNRLEWLTRCVGLRLALDPAVRHVWEGSAKQGKDVFLLVDPDGKYKTVTDKDGEPLELAAPLHAKTAKELGRTLSKRPDFPT